MNGKNISLGKGEDTLKSLTYTLNKIFLQDRTVIRYELPEEEPIIAAEKIYSNEYGRTKRYT